MTMIPGSIVKSEQSGETTFEGVITSTTRGCPRAKVYGIGERPADQARIMLEVKDGAPVWFGPKPGEWYVFHHAEAIRRVKDQDWTPPKTVKDGNEYARNDG